MSTARIELEDSINRRQSTNDIVSLLTEIIVANKKLSKTDALLLALVEYKKEYNEEADKLDALIHRKIVDESLKPEVQMEPKYVAVGIGKNGNYSRSAPQDTFEEAQRRLLEMHDYYNVNSGRIEKVYYFHKKK